MRKVGTRYRRVRAASRYDAIVVGSGIGGLTTAAILAKTGKKVCVLEQHYTAGGLTHAYVRNGYEWDVGLHYVGDVGHRGRLVRRLYDLVSNRKIQWAKMDRIYDRIIIGDRTYEVPAGLKDYADALKDRFPLEHAAIDRYTKLVICVGSPHGTLIRFFAGHALPAWIAWAHRRVLRWLVPKQCFMTTRETLESLTTNQELIAVLTGFWGDYAVPPADSSFLSHAMIANHYMEGAYYPVGGSQAISENIVSVIQEAGGDVFTYATVEEVSVESGRVTGVVMSNGDRLLSEKVISNIGAFNTFTKLLTPSTARSYGYERVYGEAKHSIGYLCLYLGLKGTASQLSLPRSNIWIHPTNEYERNLHRYIKNPAEEFPFLYISFPSAKDPTWSDRYPGRSTVEIITVAPSEWFDRWSGTTWNKRGEEYELLKAAFSKRLLDVLFAHMPHLREALDYYELSTPLSAQWFQKSSKGEMYGLEHTTGRHQLPWLRPTTRVKGLFITGQDVVNCGVSAALFAGVLTSAAVLGMKAWRIVAMLFVKPLLHSEEEQLSLESNSTLGRDAHFSHERIERS